MKHHLIGKLLPIEGFQITFRGNIFTNYSQSLTHLYQPLVGMHAVTLYQTLLNDYEIRDQIKPQTHHTLMNYLSLPLDDIYRARLKLEGIGLLNTYTEDTQETNTYTYQLNTPFSPIEFFKDDMLSQLLYHHLGQTKYNDLRQAFQSHHPEYQAISGKNVTASFDEVFDTYDNHYVRTDEAPEQNEHINTFPKQQGPQMPEGIVDFSWLEQMLTQRMLPASKVLTFNHKKLMVQMVVLYDLTEQDLENAVMWAVNEDNLLDAAEFKSACHDLFLSKQQTSDIKLVEKSKPSRTNSDPKQHLNKEEQFIRMLEEISPRQLLEDLSGGNAASSQDLKVISDVMAQQGLTPGVMNVLVHYVLLKTDMKLSKAYLEKIASHWTRKNVTNVRQAMMLAKSENQKYQQWGSNKQSYKKSSKKEVIPDWFKERNQQQSKEKQKPSASENENEDIAELLKKYAEDKKSRHL